MTYLDKLRQDHPEIHTQYDVSGCPHDYGYDHEVPKGCATADVTCYDCWRRDIPEEKETYSHEEVKEMLNITDEDLAEIPYEAVEFIGGEIEVNKKIAEKYNSKTKTHIIEEKLIEKAMSGEEPGAWVDKVFKHPCGYYTDGTEKIRGIRHNGDDIDETPILTDDIKEVFDTPLNSIKDSGDRTEFATGAVRDMHEGKGRCDLLPLDIVGKIYEYLFGEGEASWIFYHLSNFQNEGLCTDLVRVLDKFHGFDDSIDTMFLEVAKHFEDGAKKYGEYNWQKGIPANCYIDSAVRHYLKYLRGDQDERHDRAFVWNILCCIWTCKHKPELNTYLMKKGEEDE